MSRSVHSGFVAVQSKVNARPHIRLYFFKPNFLDDELNARKLEDSK